MLICANKLSLLVRFKPIYLVIILCVSSCSRVELDNDPAREVRHEIANLKTALASFREDCGRWPRTSEGLTALIKRPADTTERQWRGPYLRTMAIPKDAWGREYVYRCPDASTNGFALYSLGPDGVSRSGGNDPDDINGWPNLRR
jgi:general secretion pathway protein G